MVKRSVLEKLDDKELENYIKSDSRFVSKAVKFAYEILKERGREFSNEEVKVIQDLIKEKEIKENYVSEIKSESLDKNVTEDLNAIELYSQSLIWIFSLIFGVLFGAVLQGLNFLKLKNKSAFYVTILFGIVYSTFQVIVLNFIDENLLSKNRYKNSLILLVAGIGALILLYIWKKYMPKDLKYRKKSFLIPLIISVVIYMPILYLIIKGY